MFAYDDTRSAQGGPWTLAQHLAFPGRAGVAQTVRMMREFVRAYRVLPAIRNRAVDIVRGVPEKSARAEIDAVYQWVRANIRYVQDVHEVETLTTPDKTIALGAGDCDDQSVLLAALAESIGYPTRFVTAGYTSPLSYEHVYTEIFVGDEWVPADTTEGHGLGWEAPHFIVRRVERV